VDTVPEISPRLQKGAIVSLDATLGIPLGTISLQYNPESITRSLKPQTVGDQPDRTEILRLTGPPVETIISRFSSPRFQSCCSRSISRRSVASLKILCGAVSPRPYDIASPSR